MICNANLVNDDLIRLWLEKDFALQNQDMRAALVAEARTFMYAPATSISTKFRHQGRSKWRWLDCIGLLTKTAHGCGIPVVDHTRYRRVPDPLVLLAKMQEQLDPIPNEEALIADIGLFHIRGVALPQHVAMLSPSKDGAEKFYMIHTYDDARIGTTPGKVVENPLDEQFWQPMWHSTWRFRHPWLR